MAIFVTRRPENTLVTSKEGTHLFLPYMNKLSNLVLLGRVFVLDWTNETDGVGQDITDCPAQRMEVQGLKDVGGLCLCATWGPSAEVFVVQHPDHRPGHYLALSGNFADGDIPTYGECLEGGEEVWSYYSTEVQTVYED